MDSQGDLPWYAYRLALEGLKLDMEREDDLHGAEYEA